jgi:hypothetical protein
MGPILVNTLAKWLRGWAERSPEHRQAVADIALVNSLPLEAAKRKALTLISDTKRFRTKPASSQWDNVIAKQLGPATASFFDAYESVEEIGREFAVGRAAVRASSLRQGFLRIGSDFESSELVLRPGEDRVFIVTDPEHDLDSGSTTIFHAICLLE